MEDRRLAAIMFTDIVGYTALMGEDEDLAFQLLKKNRALQRPIIEKHGGTWLKEIGDAILASFSTDSDAVYCAKEIQESCREEPDLQLRIGIHEGEVVFEEGDVYGDGVNIASRLQSIAPAEGIYISETVNRNIENKTGIDTQFVKQETLKNVKHPIRIYQVDTGLGTNRGLGTKHKRSVFYLLGVLLIITIAITVWNQILSRSPFNLEKSIAVLPFKNLSNNPDDQYLADGMMDAILNHLYKIENLSVRSRTSTEQYRDPDRNISDIAKGLNANYILEGSFQKIGEKANLTVQLIIAETDEHIWAEDYNRDWTDIFTVQSAVAQTIAKEVEVAISPEVMESIELIPTENLEAYELYLKGKEYYYKGGETNLNTAIHFYHEAIELDSKFALAYIALGIVYNDQTYWSDYFKESFGDTLLYFADEAIALDPDLAEAYWLRGVYFQQNGKVEYSNKQFEKAIDINPNYGNSYWMLGWNYLGQGQYIKAIIHLEKAKKIKIGDPDYSDLLWQIMWAYSGIGHFEKSELVAKELINYKPLVGFRELFNLALFKGDFEKQKYYTEKICAIDSGVYCISRLGLYNLNKGNYLQALAYYEKYRDIAQQAGDLYYFIRDQHRYAFVLHKLNRPDEAKQLIEEQIEYCQESIRLNRPYAVDGGALFDLAAIYTFLNENEKALQLILENENGVLGAYFPFMLVDPLYENLWDNEEFKQFTQRQEKKYADIRAELDRMRAEGRL